MRFPVALVACLAAGTSGISEEFMVSWGFEDWDYPPNRFPLEFSTSVSITRIQGFVSASMLPIGPYRIQRGNRIRWGSLKCHNGSPLADNLALKPKYAEREGNQRPKKYNQQLGIAAVELEMRQQDRYPIHIPVHVAFQPGEFVVHPGEAFYCDTDMKTFTGDKDELSTLDVDCLDVEVHLLVSYVEHDSSGGVK